MVISKPCQHPECPPREGFVRGEYESIEFIREIPVKKLGKSHSTTDLHSVRHSSRASCSLDKEAILRHAEQRNGASNGVLGNPQAPNGLLHEHSSHATNEITSEGRARGKTISFAESRGRSAKGEALDNPHDDEDPEMNPVEWIMITRSDPGGSVPRFMVERGTPSGIVADASKFLDWACAKEHPDEEPGAPADGKTDLDAYNTNGHMSGLDGVNESDETTSLDVQNTDPIQAMQQNDASNHGAKSLAEPPVGLLSSVAQTAYAGIESLVPQAIATHLPLHQTLSSSTNVPYNASADDDRLSLPSSPSSTSILSFASAESNLSDTASPSTASKTTSLEPPNPPSSHSNDLANLTTQTTTQSTKHQKALAKEAQSKLSQTLKETTRLQKSLQKQSRDLQRAEARHAKELQHQQAKRDRDAQRDQQRRQRIEDKDLRATLVRERDLARLELEVARKQALLLTARMGELQKENTALVAGLGRLDGGQAVLELVREGGLGR